MTRTMKKLLFESIINSEWYENKEVQDKVEKVEKSDEAAQIICEFEQIIRSKNKNITQLAQQQGNVFVKFNGKFCKIELYLSTILKYFFPIIQNPVY